jgi:hypothetical protein
MRGEIVEEHKLETIHHRHSTTPTNRKITNQTASFQEVNSSNSGAADFAEGPIRFSPGVAVLPNSHDCFRITSGSGSDPRLGLARNGTKVAESPNNADHTQESPPVSLEQTSMGLSGTQGGRDRLHRNSQHSEPKMNDNNNQFESLASFDSPLATEGKDHEDDSTTVHSIESSVPSPALSAQEAPASEATAGSASVMTTPSTVSTAPSTTDEASLILDPAVLERLTLRMEGGDALGLGLGRHRRVPSWDPQLLHPLSEPAQDFTPVTAAGFGSPYAPSGNVWASPQVPARIASFRSEAGADSNTGRYGYRPNENLWNQPPPTGVLRGNGAPADPRMYRPGPYSAYPAPTGGPHRVHHGSLPPTPPRAGGRGQRQAPSPHRPGSSHSSPMNTSSSPGHSGPGNARSSAEVLKTLLRKKACLYEPDTSRAVALVTWLVGRELGLELGFFSRQQLQAGVHACVASKIDSGVITRTKVNRCMQIILNSCFHYIIPRPDGSEESGAVFRLMFAREVTDDMLLLRELPVPWNDLAVAREAVITAASQELLDDTNKNPSTPQTSPSLGPKDPEDHESDPKRAVLLCFNENVRCAEDVFRCHNEFIRDTAHASHLQLSSHEWKHFFGAEAAGAPHLWGNIGIPVATNEMRDPAQVDALGVLSVNELSKFRTFWCSKRYEHEHELCGFAHTEVNGGWLRRNPSHYSYKAEMCQFVSKRVDGRMNSKIMIINECPHGMHCEYAHSVEEMYFHPMRYKNKLCGALHRTNGVCHLGDACPDFHPMESYRFPSKKIESRAGARHSRHTTGGKNALSPPVGSPILYASPAPPSRFEDHLTLPGLRSLYRRQCSVVRAHVRNRGQCLCCYSNFGDDDGVGADPSSTLPPARGLPKVRRAQE